MDGYLGLDKFSAYIIMFFIYGLLGYIAEVVYVFILTKKITNRGYLFGPIVPIYAFGALMILVPLLESSIGSFIYDRWYLVVIIGFLYTTLLEYLTSFVLEKIFHMRWWDYSDKFLNLNGRVCLLNSTLFTILVVLVVYLLNPLILGLIGVIMDIKVLPYVISFSLILIFIIDFVISTIKHINISKLIRKLAEIKDMAYEYKDKKMDELSNMINDNKEKLDNMVNKFKDKLKNINVKYPTMKLIKNRKKISVKELLDKKER